MGVAVMQRALERFSHFSLTRATRTDLVIDRGGKRTYNDLVDWVRQIEVRMGMSVFDMLLNKYHYEKLKAWRRWQCANESQILARHRAALTVQQCVAQWKAGTVLQAWKQWKDVLQAKADALAVLRKYIVKTMKVWTRRGFAKWLVFMREVQYEQVIAGYHQAVMRRIVVRMLNQQVTNAVLLWRTYAEGIRLLEAFVVAMQNALCRKALVAWSNTLTQR